MNILLTVAYDGTDYCGWQYQENGVTVQEKLQTALGSVLGQPISVTAASRTDAGVHALGQRAAFRIEKLQIPCDKLSQVVNSFLPPDIVLQNAELVSDELHPRFDVKQKTYVYKILNSRYANPLQSRYAWHVPYALDVSAMDAAAAFFVGEHDFAAFCAAGGSAKTTVRSVYSCNVTKQNDVIQISVCGSGFLYNMVRIIAGTLAYVGAKKIMPDEIPGIIESHDRTRAGKTAPPCGLCLTEICYQ